MFFGPDSFQLENYLMKWFIIVNPAAGGGSVLHRWPKIEEILNRIGLPFTMQFTERRGHAIQLVDEAVRRGFRHILGVGGDGTNHELINGLMRQTYCAPADITYALLPFGTGNDWVRTHGISRKPEERLKALLNPNTVLHDIGHVRYKGKQGEEDRYFVNVAGLAYDGYIVHRLNGRTIRNRLIYLMMIGRYLFSYKPERVQVKHDQGAIHDFFYTINLGIARFSGGGMQLAPHAVPDDGLLALTVVRSLSKLSVLFQTPRLFRGTLLKHPKAEGFQTLEAHIHHEQNSDGLHVEADGEYLGKTPAVFSVLERVIRIAL